jgi:hypothetical protein
MSAVTSDNVLRVRGRWLALALWLLACAEDPVQPPADDDDDSDVGAEAPADDDSDDDSKPTRDAGRADGGAAKDGGKATNDARAPARPDTGSDQGNEPSDGDDDEGDDAATGDDDDGSDAGTRSDGGTTPKPTGDGGGSSGESDSGAPAERMDLGKGDGKDVITIGDSWMSLIGTGIQQSLVKASGQPYRTYGVLGTRLLDGVIPGQYDRAKREDPDIKTVVMTGGGNDILMNPIGDPMKVIDMVAVRLDQLWTQMGKDGVQDVVYVEYSEGGSNGANVRYGIEKVGPVCMNHKAVRCHFMLSDPIIMKRLADGIHPTSDGYDKLGKAVHELMVKEGMRR